MREFEAIVAYLEATGTPHRVTSTTGGRHAPGSYHYQGCAVDFAGPAPTRNSPQLLAVFAAFGPVESRLAELIYSGGPYNIKDGKRVPRYAVAAHWDHVHVAVKPGVYLPHPKPVEVKAMFDPPLPIVAYLDCPTGGSWLLGRDGAVFAVGGAPYLGGANGKSYFVGRTAARFNLVDGKYQIVATSGELYGPGF